MNPKMLRWILAAVVAMPIVAVGLVVAFGGKPGWSPMRRLPVLGAVPEFALTEASGQPLLRDNLRNCVWIASFIFTRCGGVCPMMMRHQVRLQGQLPLRDDLRLVSFSVDPDYDTPKVLREYAKAFGSDRNRWLFATGDKKQIYTLAIDGFRLGTQDANPAEEMPILHSSKLVLVDRHGFIRGYYDTDNDGVLKKLAREVELVLAERS